MKLKLYKFLTKYFSGLFKAYIYYRLFKGKEDNVRIKERFGIASTPRPKGFIIWFHAASIGESVSVLPLIFKIAKKYPALNILVTTGTVTSSKIMASRLPKNAIHQFVPIDTHDSVKKFLYHWKPDLAFWIESELWPNLILETSRIKTPMILVNGRISEESYIKWKRNLIFAREILSKFALCLVQTEDDNYRYSELGARKVEIAGNLKYEAPALPGIPTEFGNLIKQIGYRNIWLAASTHQGEEEVVISTHKKLKEKFPDLLTIIMPRHPKKASEIISFLKNNKLPYAQRSKKEQVKPEAEVYIADTIGELGLFYRLSNIVFMGGSIVKHGGQNPLEAARLECAILSGEYYFNFEEIYNEMKAKHCVMMVKSADDLVTQVGKLLSDNKLRNNYSYMAMEFVNSKRGVLAKYFDAVAPYLNELK